VTKQSQVFEYRLTIEELKLHYRYPWQSESESLSNAEWKDIHDLLHRFEALCEIMEERERRFIEMMSVDSAAG
jgi:hypothetical protein